MRLEPWLGHCLMIPLAFGRYSSGAAILGKRDVPRLPSFRVVCLSRWINTETRIIALLLTFLMHRFAIPRSRPEA